MGGTKVRPVECFLQIRTPRKLRGWIRAELSKELFSMFLKDPDAFVDQVSAKYLKQGLKIHVVKATLTAVSGEAKDVIIKRIRHLSFFRRLSYFFWQSPARRALRGALLLEKKGIQTPKAIAVCEDRNWTNLGTSYFVTEEVKDSVPLGHYWRRVLPALPRGDRIRLERKLLKKAAEFVFRLHAARIDHGDLKASNLLVRPLGGGGFHLYMVDVDRVREYRLLSWKRKIKNLVQLNNSVGRSMSVKGKIIFLRRYAELCSLSRNSWKALAKKVQVGTWEEERKGHSFRVLERGIREKNKLLVVFVVGGLPYGGIENVLLDLASNLDQNQFQVGVINLSGAGILVRKFREKGIRVLNLGFRLSTIRLDCTWRLRRLLMSLDPDIIFTSQFAANYHARLAALGLRAVVMTQVHNIKREPYWERRSADRFLGGIRTDRFIAVSKKVEEELTRAVPASVGKTTVLYNAVALDRLKLPPGYSREKFRRQEGFGDRDFLVLAVGRLVYQKGFDILLAAFADVVAAVPEGRLLIAGDGSMWQELMTLIKERSLDGKVRLLGYRSDIPCLLAACNLFVMPSRWEGFGLAALEAITMGVPTIITETSPIAEVVTDEMGVKVVSCDAGAIARAIVSVARTEEGENVLRITNRLRSTGGMGMREYASQIEKLFLDFAPSKRVKTLANEKAHGG